MDLHFALLVIGVFLLGMIVSIISTKTGNYYYNLGREEVLKINPIILEYTENRKSIMGYGDISRSLNDIQVTVFHLANYVNSVSGGYD
jgi:hypothetical protein